MDHRGKAFIPPISTNLRDPCTLTISLLCLSADTLIPLHLTSNGIKKVIFPLGPQQINKKPLRVAPKHTY